MMLLNKDVERILRLGYGFHEFAFIDENGFIRLKNIDNHCIFLDPKTCKCKIYEFRPIGCRLYPIIYVEGVGVVIDTECPAHNTIEPRELNIKAKLLIQVIRKLKEEAKNRKHH